jgi:hypothetical protein
MKTNLAVAVCLVLGLWAFAGGEDAQCTFAYTTANAGSTVLSQDGGSCPLPMGGSALLQCDNKVYFSTGRAVWNPDGGITSLMNVGDAGFLDFAIDFGANSDPYILPLGNQSNVINAKGVSALGICKVGPTFRARP